MSKVHWLALSLTPGIGGVTARRLVQRFGSVEGVFDASDEELLLAPRITEEIAADLRSISLDALQDELASLDDEGVYTITWDDDDYPPNLREISDAPPVLFVRGRLLPEDVNAVAIVGTRDPSPDGFDTAKALAFELSARGLVVVSGLAIGIDTAAHQGALLGGGRTIAVLGNGIHQVHPRSNLGLAEEITQSGVVMSELHPNTPPSGSNLMARDRIVSGLSRAVIVVEAGIKSGSMDTAAKAHKQGRLVYAAPGTPGTDELLAQGAGRLELASFDPDEFVNRVKASDEDKGPQLNLWG